MRIIVYLLIVAMSACTEEDYIREDDPSLHIVKLYTVKKRTEPENHYLHAHVENADTADLKFEISGEISNIPIFEGQQLRRGETIAELNATDYALALDYAEAEHLLAIQELSRITKLYDLGTLPLSELDTARTREEMLSIRVAQAEEALKDCKITAPFDGIVLQRFQEAHNSIVAGEIIARFASSDKIELVADLPEDLVAQISNKGITAASARFSAKPQLSWQLSIVEQRGDPNITTQTYRTRFALHKIPDWILRQGMTASITLALAQPSNRLVVPVSALHTDPDEAFYLWVTSGPDFFVKKRFIKIGTVQGGLLEITDGLIPGEIVVATGGSLLNENDRITPLTQ